MNKINFEREFDERLDNQFESRLDALISDKVDAVLASKFGDAYASLQAMPTEDQSDSETVYVDTVNDVLKVSSSGT